jgi:uncharacterized protein YllA (UPF0747 family)
VNKLTAPSVNSVYEDYIWHNENRALAEKLYSSPPLTFGSLDGRISKLMDQYSETKWHSESRMKKMKSALIRINRQLGTLTPKVESNIEHIEYGTIESAHQSVVLGGPVYILNKAATAERIAAQNSTPTRPLAPFFCVADYDIVQNELTHMRTPLMGSGGTLVSLPIDEEYISSPVSTLPLPDYQWLEVTFENIRAGYRPLFKLVDSKARLLLEERLERTLTVLKYSYINSQNLGQWAASIYAHLFNIEGNLGIPLLTASDPEVRDLWALGMELLIQRETREKFVRQHNEITELIIAHGFEAGIGMRSDDYVPFYYECDNSSCHRSRTEMSFVEKGSSSIIQGKCPSCGELIEVEVSSAAPDLSDVANSLSPRVDTRQFIVDTSIPVLAHAGGPGETAYYAQVIPIAHELGLPFPMYIKYPRIFFNTPWNEDLGKTLDERELPVLHSSDLYSLLGRVARFRKKNRVEEMNEQLLGLASLIRETHEKLNEAHRNLSDRIESSGPKTVSEDLMIRLDLERYLSWVYGQFAEGKEAQESSWSWIEWALNSGLADLFGPYQRAYIEGMKHGATLFVNFVV